MSTGSYTAFAAASGEIVPGMVVRISQSNAVLPACADRLHHAACVYGIAMGFATSMERALGADVQVCAAGTVNLAAEHWGRVAGGPLTPGATYHLSDREPGHLSTMPGNFHVQVGMAVSDNALLLRIEPPRLHLPGRIVESAWLRNDRRAFALVFADGEQQVWEVGGDDDRTIEGEGIYQPRIEGVFQKVSGDLPQGSLRGAFGVCDLDDFMQSDYSHPSPPLSHATMLIGADYATIALLGRGATLERRDAADRAMRSDETWSEV